MEIGPFRLARAALLVAAAASLFASAALAGPAPKPSVLVTLIAQTGVVTDCPDGGMGFAQQTGNLFVPFAIPPKRVLVVTSIDWRTGVVMPERTITATFTSQATGTPTVYLAQSHLRSDSSASVGGTLVIPSGVAVASGRTVCIEVEGLSFSMLHGYLAKDK